jgi:Immunity protein 21
VKQTEEANWTWISSYGGPLLLIPGEYLYAWEGGDAPSNGRQVQAKFRWAGPDDVATDYDRACDVEGWIGRLEVGDGSAVVLGGEPAMTAWLPAAPSTVDDSDIVGYLVRWIAADSMDMFRTAVKAALQDPRVQWRDERVQIQVGSQPLFLFEAACPGTEMEDGEFLGIDVTAGTYGICTAEYTAAPRTSIVLHRFALSR